MENKIEVMQQQNNVPAREIGVITAEIKEICRQAQRMALIYAVEIGRRLEEAKRALPYGQWGEWLKNEVEFSQSTANNFMRLYEEYGSAQISIFGAVVDSQSFVNLPYSKALLLLAVPSDEREEFAEEVGAEDLSVKELKAAIAERDKAKRDAKILEDKLAEAEAAAKEAEELAGEAEKYRQDLAGLEENLRQEREKNEGLRERLKKAETDPKIPKATLDKIRNEAAAVAQKNASAEYEKQVEETARKLKEAEEAAASAKQAEERARAALEEAQKKLKTARPEIAAFKALFDQFQQMSGKLKTMIQAISRDDAETGGKLAAALRAFGGTL